MTKEPEKISRKLNDILIDRIRKYQSQDVTQLLNSPMDEDSNNSYLGGLINFVGDDTNNLDDEINNFLDKISYDEIYIESLPDNEYNNDMNEEEEEENENDIGKDSTKGIKIMKEIKIEKNNNINNNIKNNELKTLDNIISSENNKETINANNNIDSENNMNINIFLEKNNDKSIRTLLAENYNTYFDLISANYEKYDNNHFPKIIILDKDNTKKIMLNNLFNKVFYTEDGQKIIINDNIYETSLAYLKNKQIYKNIPQIFKKEHSKYTLNIELLDESIENIQSKNLEFIEINKLVSTSMSKIILFCNQLDKYIHQKLEPFNNSINTSYQKINNKKQIISEIKEKTLKNSADIILKKLKMNNIFKLMTKLKIYTKIQNNMNILEKLLSDPKNYQKTLDLINKCKKDINLEKAKIEVDDPILILFENKLAEYKNENDGYMSGELSQVLTNYFNNFIIIESKTEEENDNNKSQNQFLVKYDISEFVSKKIFSFNKKYKNMINNINFSEPKEELEKMGDICDYYIKSNLINNMYTQLRGIFLTLSENILDNIISSFKEELKEEEIEIKNEINDENSDKKENIKDIEKNNDENIHKEICILLCFLIAKNKFKEILLNFIDILSTKLEKNEKSIDIKIINEVNYIKLLVQKNIKDKFLNQIQKCLNLISQNTNLDTYINNFYLVLEMLRNEVSNYDNEKNDENNEQILNNNDNNNDNNDNNENPKTMNDLHNVIIEEQKTFIDNMTKNVKSKFETEKFKSWESIKDIPQRYQNILNVFLNFDINNNCLKDEFIITEFPSEKIKLIKELEDEEEEKTNNSENSTDINNQLLSIKDGEKPEIKIKVNQTLLEIIQLSFDILKMFTIFHKDCYGYILENFRKMLVYHLDFQTEQIYNGKCGFSVSQQEISITNVNFILIEYIYEHIKTSEFLYTVADADNGDSNIVDNYLDLDNNINKCFDLSKKKIADLIENHCIGKTLDKLQEIKLPYYNVVSGDFPVNEYCIYYVSSLKDIYESMNFCYEENFIKEMMKKGLDDFFEKFEDYILYGNKIEDENCLKQFKKDMIFLKKNLVFITIIDLTEVKNRIDNINKSVLPEWLRAKKK